MKSPQRSVDAALSTTWRRIVVVPIVVAVVVVAGNARLLAEGILSNTNKLSAGDLLKVVSNKEWVIVDTRTTDAFNGWALGGIKRGGHIPGSVDFCASWLDVESESKTTQLAAALKAKGIDREKRIVLTSIEKTDRVRVAEYLHELGFRNLFHFDFNEWVSSGSPLKRYPHYDRLVPPWIVKQLIEGAVPETFEKAVRIKVVEASWGGEAASYSKGHIPGSFHVNTDHFEPPPTWALGSNIELTQFAKDYGFQADDTVVIASADVTASYRLAVVLKYMGVNDVRVLNGGFAAWKRAGYPVETERKPLPTAMSFGAEIPKRPNLIVGVDHVKIGLKKRDEFVLVDTRTWAEFMGETSGYSYHRHKGRIPGSTYGQADFTGKNSLTPYRNIDATMRNADEILKLWQESGITTNKELCFMCGGGWRAAETLTFARVIGVANTTLYSDGWIGWSNDKTNPVEAGPIKTDSQ
jgi:3-mercaptopyruvate sulfurtransferase SseA